MSYFRQDSPPFNPHILEASGSPRQQQHQTRPSRLPNLTGKEKHRLPTNTHLSANTSFLSFLKNTQTLPPKSTGEAGSAEGLGGLPARLTFTWPGSPGRPPSAAFTGLLSTRGLTTWRKGLHSGQPLTLMPAEKRKRES